MHEIVKERVRRQTRQIPTPFWRCRLWVKSSLLFFSNALCWPCQRHTLGHLSHSDCRRCPIDQIPHHLWRHERQRQEQPDLALALAFPSGDFREGSAGQYFLEPEAGLRTRATDD